MKIVSLNFEIVRATPAVAEFIVRVDLDGSPRVGNERPGHRPRAGVHDGRGQLSARPFEKSDNAVSMRCADPEPNPGHPMRHLFTRL